MRVVSKSQLAVLMGTLVMTSACSSIRNIINVDAVDDNVDYRSQTQTIKALAVPPGLDSPGFDDTYAVSSEDIQQTSVASYYPESVATAGAQNAEPPAPVEMPKVAMTSLKSGQPALAVDTSASNNWLLLKGILPKVGFSVLQAQPAQGLYTVKYDGITKYQSGGFMDRINNSFASNDLNYRVLNRGQSYMLVLAENAENQSFIAVANAQGEPESEKVSTRILERLKEQFESKAE